MIWLKRRKVKIVMKKNEIVFFDKKKWDSKVSEIGIHQIDYQSLADKIY